MKKLLCLSVVLLCVGCARKDYIEQEQVVDYQPTETTSTPDCTYGAKGIRQAVKNNLIFRKEIREDFRACMTQATPKDRKDVKDLTDACLDTAHKLNGGIIPNQWTGITTGTISSVEASLYACGEI